MSKTFDSIVMLKTVSITVAIALLMWSLGLPTLTAQAANVSNFSVTLTDSAPSAVTDLTIEFTTPNGLENGDDITITLEDFGSVDEIDTGDFQIDVDTVDVTDDFSLVSTANTLVFTLNTGTIGEDADVVILVGTNAGGTNQVTNPTSTGSYKIQVDLENSDSGETQVAIVNTVEVTASVDTVFTFTIDGVAGGQTVNGTTTTGSASAIAIPFGTLVAGQASTTAQDLTVTTNANNGFAVTVQTDQPLQSTTGAIIQGFVDGSDTTTPTAWARPGGDVEVEETWGHWGLTTQDDDLAYGAGNYVAATTNPVIVFEHDGPADGETPHVGATRVGYTIEISALQPAADDYTTTLTYIATPVF